jgi:hypothetical protein
MERVREKKRWRKEENEEKERKKPHEPHESSVIELRKEALDTG